MSFLRSRKAKALDKDTGVKATFYDGEEAVVSNIKTKSSAATVEEDDIADILASDNEFQSVITSSATHRPCDTTVNDGVASSHNPSASKMKHANIQLSKSHPAEEHIGALLSDKHMGALLSDKEIYELQLTQLQEQLVAAMIDNQQLTTELHSYKEKSKLDSVMEDLKLERKKNAVLIARCEDLSGERLFYSQKSEQEQAGDGRVPDETDSVLDAVVEATDVLSTLGKDNIYPESSQSSYKAKSWRERLHEWSLTKLFEFAADFTEADKELQDEGEGPPLTVKLLKKNVSRFSDGVRPIVGTIKGMNDIVSWKYPSLSLLSFVLYMYFVWCGWFIPFVLFLLIFRLFISYLKHDGWNIDVQYFDYGQDMQKQDAEADDKPGTFTIVLQVTRKVQNMLAEIADRLEKLKNLLMWEHPRESRKLFFGLCGLFVATCLFSAHTLLLYTGLYLGFKIFVINYLYGRFPRLRKKYDAEYKLWQSLMNDEQLEISRKRHHIEELTLPGSPSCADEDEVTASLWDAPAQSGLPKQVKKFCDKFSLPYAEAPAKGFSTGKNCLLINKDKIGPSGIKPGLLYLTRSFLCWERTGVGANSTSIDSRITIPLTEIERVEKHKPFAILPGGGMSIMVQTNKSDKPYIFAGLFNRDECFSSIVAAGHRENLPWAFYTDGTSKGGSGMKLSDLQESS